MYGVSPSYFFSAFSVNFTAQDYAAGIKTLRNLGFDSFQGEIYRKEEISNWEKNKRIIADTYEDENLDMSVFVSHFLIQSTKSLDDLKSDWGYDELKRVCEIVKSFSSVETIVIPISPYEYHGERYEEVEQHLVRRFEKYSTILKDASFNLALEIIPHSIIGGSDGLLRLIDQTGSSNLGYNLDTGHANTSGEVMSLLPYKLKGKIYSTHLKDNFGDENLALPPGKADIDFETLLKNLNESGYRGSYDLEISSSKDNLVRDYKFGLNYITGITKKGDKK
jgi:sugar phosphate isomerase/epimerase